LDGEAQQKQMALNTRGNMFALSRQDKVEEDKIMFSSLAKVQKEYKEVFIHVCICLKLFIYSLILIIYC